jgi:hypothetical protein
MTATTPSTALATIQPSFTDAERLALAGFLAGYRGLTREACTLDPRHRPDDRRVRRRPALCHRGQAAAGPARRRPDRPPGDPSRPDRQARQPAHAAARVHHRALDAGVPLRDVQEAASHADPRTTMRYDRARTSLDRHATYIVAAFIAGAAR